MSWFAVLVDRRAQLAASSRDGHLALRRVERQQALIERLHAARGGRVLLDQLAQDLHVSRRTIARDVERLRMSGVPLNTHPGRAGGIRLTITGPLEPVVFDLPEAAALLSSLAVLGPSVSDSATSAMRKLTAALRTKSALQ